MAFCICWAALDLLLNRAAESFTPTSYWLGSEPVAPADRSTSPTGVAATNSFADCGGLYPLAALGGRSFPHCAAVLVNHGHAHHHLWLCVALDFDQSNNGAVLSQSPAKQALVGSGFRPASDTSIH